jgi:sarcosine oxidase gamma subunit
MDSAAALEPIAAPGVALTAAPEFHIAALRYFDAEGFAAALKPVIGGPLPQPLRAVCYPVAAVPSGLLLAWRSPTECWLLTSDATAFASILNYGARVAAAGCLVDQTGGFTVWRLAGTRVRAVLERVGSSASMPAPGEARSSRLAELPVTVLRVEEGGVLLLVERVYAEHWLGWMRETMADLA